MRESTKAWNVEGGMELKIIGTGVFLVAAVVIIVPSLFSSSPLYSHGSMMRIAPIVKETTNMDSKRFLDNKFIITLSQCPCHF